MKNILMIHQSSELYGSDKTFLSLVKYFIKFKINVIAIIPSDGPLKTELLHVGATVIVRPILKAQRSMFSIKNLFYFFYTLITSLFFYSRLIKKHNIQYIYSNTIAVLDGALIKTIHRNKIKHVWHIHEILEDLGFFNKIYGHLINRYTDIIITNSNATKHYVAQLTNKTEIHVVYNGIDSTPYSKAKELKEKNFGDKKLAIGLVGRMNDWKGHCLLLDAVDRMNKNSLDFKVVFKGSPSPSRVGYEEILQAASQNRHKQNIEIITFQKDPIQVWSDIDICVVPSTKPEPFGLVVIEAMAAGIPVIASDHGGPSEIIRDGVTGVLFYPNNVASLASCLEKIITTYDNLNPMIEAARHEVYTKYSEKNFASNVLNAMGIQKCM